MNEEQKKIVSTWIESFEDLAVFGTISARAVSYEALAKLKAEVERLKEVEWQYNDLCK